MTRSEMMANIPSKATTPELAVRRLVRKIGARMKCNYKRLPGKPDIFVPASMLAIFVHGCFWHACRSHYKTPKTNSDFWETKVRNNAARDKRHGRMLRTLGVKCLTIWEHELFDNDRVMERIREAM